MSAQDVLRQLRALGAHIECQDGRLKLRAGRRSVPERLVEQARAAKSELILLLDNPELQKQGPSPTHGDSEHLRKEISSKAAENLVFAEDAQVSAFGEHLRQENGILRDPVSTFGGEVSTFGKTPAKMLAEDAQVSTFAEAQHSCGFQAPDTPKMLTPPECWEESSFSATKTGQLCLNPKL